MKKKTIHLQTIDDILDTNRTIMLKSTTLLRKPFRHRVSQIKLQVLCGIVLLVQNLDCCWWTTHYLESEPYDKVTLPTGVRNCMIFENFGRSKIAVLIHGPKCKIRT